MRELEENRRSDGKFGFGRRRVDDRTAEQRAGSITDPQVIEAYLAGPKDGLDIRDDYGSAGNNGHGVEVTALTGPDVIGRRTWQAHAWKDGHCVSHFQIDEVGTDAGLAVAYAASQIAMVTEQNADDDAADWERLRQSVDVG